ncbi:FkbM family methyltransferase [Hoeflea sp. AS60]|uniref:FkbM family methyltransferase n=1 Tax=Hoeflea sp. AS60 TaxID=3135780 RepID=UPI00317943F6
MMKTSPSASGQRAGYADAGSVYPSRWFDRVPSLFEAHVLLQELADQACLASPVAPAGPLVIYGAGTFGRMALDFLSDVGVEPALVVDARADQIRHVDAWKGIDVRAPHEVPEQIKAEALLAVSIVTSPVSPLMQELQNQGWQNVVPFYDVAESYRPSHPLSNGWFAEPLQPADMVGITECLDAWGDDLSRAHHLSFLAWRLARQEWHFDGVSIDNSNRFFIPEVVDALKDGDLFLDGGAHHGSVSKAFLAAGAQESRIVAFEPDQANADQFEVWHASLREPVRTRVELRRVALDAISRDRKFHGGLGFMSQLTGDGPQSIVTQTIDMANLDPGFVKLHLEGGELDALKGGLETFSRSRPVIAVTVYHNADGVWRTACWLRHNLHNYCLLMRVHSWCGTGAVIYALPKERMPEDIA